MMGMTILIYCGVLFVIFILIVKGFGGGEQPTAPREDKRKGSYNVGYEYQEGGREMQKITKDFLVAKMQGMKNIDDWETFVENMNFSRTVPWTDEAKAFWQAAQSKAQYYYEMNDLHRRNDAIVKDIEGRLEDEWTRYLRESGRH